VATNEFEVFFLFNVQVNWVGPCQAHPCAWILQNLEHWKNSFASIQIYILGLVRNVRINFAFNLIFIKNGGVIWIHVQGKNNNFSTSLEFFFSIEHSCLLNSKSSSFLDIEKTFCSNWCCCRDVLQGGAKPKPKVGIQNVNAHGESHGAY